jgi:hypothetical protein
MIAQAAPGQVLHHQVNIILLDFEAVYGHNVRMVETAGNPCFLDKPLESYFIGLAGNG